MRTILYPAAAKPLLFCFFLIAIPFLSLAGSREYHTVSGSEIVNGYIVRKVWLDHYAMPSVQLLEPRYGRAASGATSGSGGVDVILGMERKKPFALVKIPVYRGQSNGTEQLTSFTLDVAETEGTEPPTTSKTTGGAAHSVLASGSWHKLSVSGRGMHKIDHAFLSSKLGVSGNISSSSIRLYGNGGTMLAEANNVPRADDLVENAIQVEDGGDGSFGPGDYILFYANGPMDWRKDSVNKQFIHRKNLYEDKSYYFLNIDMAGGKRVGSEGSASGANTTVTNYNDYHVVEDDKVSVGRFGKQWWGDEFSTVASQGLNRTYNFDLGQGVDSIHLRIMIGAKNLQQVESFNIQLNGQHLGNILLDLTNIGKPDDHPVKSEAVAYLLPFNGTQASVSLTFDPAGPDSKGYLNFIEINTRRSLIFGGSQVSFRDWNSVGTGKVAEYRLAGANGNVRVWDVTDPLQPVRINGSLNGSEYVFARDAASLHEFVAFEGSSFSTPEYVGKVDNQDLHGLPQTDYFIVSDKAFLPAANRLADFHRGRGLRVEVVTPQQIYNEFSSGGQDLSAIRDFVRLFYDRAGTDEAEMPKNLLLFGDASIDYKNRLPGNTNYVPTFESEESERTLEGYCSDDFFGFLDSVEDIEDYSHPNTLDIGIGRLPVKTTEEANDIVHKIFHYKSPASLGPWRLSAIYASDNDDGAGFHLGDVEDALRVQEEKTGLYNTGKVYLDNIPFVSTPGGARAPEANKIINSQVYKGTFIINYAGHGNIYTLADERILTADDFNNWKNYNALPIVVTATCDFSQFDRPDFVSAGEKLILKNNGGAIAMLTTTQAVFASGSTAINQDFIRAQFNRNANGAWPSFGEAFREGKNETYNHSLDSSHLYNFRKFTLLGDPALLPAFPEHKVQTDSVIDVSSGNIAGDTLKALGSYCIKARVRDNSGALLPAFNGTASITIYDKPRLVRGYGAYHNIVRYYRLQDNIIYRGKVTVTNGEFSVSFIVPRDINYDFGTGKISYYVENGQTDGAGTDSTIRIGGFSDNPVVDNDPPRVRPYMNDTLFRDGGLTGTNTLLYAILEDETGINTSGSGVGHDITAVLDDDLQNPMILNDYYETEPNSYRRGVVRFPLQGLPDGPHKLRVKAWDVNNNSGEGTVHFEVANGQVTKIRNLMNYPNPFSTFTHFVFEHNHPEEVLNFRINIYNTAGVLVKTLSAPFTPSGSRSNEITWDGTDQNGARLPSGVYVYRLLLSTEQGFDATAYQKLVLIR